jgi:hypothetical protein
MKAILGRLRRLEQRVNPPENPEARRSVVLLRERRRRRLEAAGLPFEDAQPESASTGPVRWLSAADTIRGIRRRRLEARLSIPTDIS